MKSWPERRVSNSSDEPATASWVGDQWCQYHFEGSYITCGSTTCFPGAMTISERPRKQGATANSWVPSGNQWDCSNGCDISFVGGTWLYDCGGANTGELGGGGGNGVNPPGATLTCTPSVVFGGVATCVVSIDGYAEGDDEVHWSFAGASPYVGLDTSETNYSLTWQGQVAASGIVTASITANGVPYSGLSDTLNVSPRTGWSWANTVTGSDGAPGEIDNCFRANDVGLTTAATCNSPDDAGYLFYPKEGALDAGNGVTFDVIDTQGPNQGFWYLSAVTATMDLRAQLVRRWRESGDASAYTLPDTLVQLCGNAAARTIKQANHCAPSSKAAFDTAVSVIWKHERRHIDTAKVAAADGPGDVHKRFSTLVRGDSLKLVFALRTSYTEAHEHVFNRSDAVDNVGFVFTDTLRTFDRPGSNWVVRPSRYAR